MPNAVLDRLRADRDKQIEFVDATLAAAERDSRDLVDAEVANVNAARERIAELDKQIAPLADFEELRESAASRHADQLGRRDGAPPTTGQARGGAAAAAHRSVGEFLVDHIRAHDPRADQATARAAADRVAQTRAVQNQTTADTPGLLPEPIVGPLVNLIDASRPFITSIGARSMGGQPGAKFYRPRVTQHTQVGKQTAEKTELPSRKMIIDQLEFAKETYGGTVDISRQAIDWTSPSAWDALINDLANQYAIETEAATAAAFAAGVTQTHAAATSDLAGYAAALYAAAADAYRGCKMLPNRIWMSLDMWALIGPIVDVVGRLTFGPSGGPGGTSSFTDFRGDMLGADRVVVPTFPDGTCVVGNSTMYEYYEEMIGLLSAVEPSILGVEVAYGGYCASGFIEPNGFAKVTAPAVGP